MYYLSQATVTNAIHNLSQTERVSTIKGHNDLLAIFLILKLRGVKYHEWRETKSIYDKEAVTDGLMLLGGLASPNEMPGKATCLLFTSFNKFKTDLDNGNPKKTNLFNNGTIFSQLSSRFKDTVDNSASDVLADKSKERLKFKEDVIENLLASYSPKYNLYDLIFWIYRYQEFDVEYIPSDLKNMFQHQFNLGDDETLALFDISQRDYLSYSTIPFDFLKFRQVLNVAQFCEINSSRLDYQLDRINVNKFYTEYKMLFNKNVDITTLKDVLLTYKQLILTGVPGVGKSYFIKELESLEGFEIIFIQFHQNYSYQDFIVGKTIINNEVKTVKGDLIQAIERAIDLEKEGKKLLLVLDEINRGNISAIFGELMYLLDRNGNSVQITALGDKAISLPDNLYIIGTMNSSDRSIAVIDYALRRRFPFVKLLPNYDLITNLVEVVANDEHNFNGLGDFLNVLNAKTVEFFKNSDYQFGHALFLKPYAKSDEKYSLTAKQLLFIIFYEIAPMLVEYNHGDESVLNAVLSKEILEANENTIIDAVKQYSFQSL